MELDLDLETRRAEFYHEWTLHKANLQTLRMYAMFLGPIGSRLYLKEWRQVIVLLFAYVFMTKLIAMVHEDFVLVIVAVLFYEWITSKSRVEKYNTKFEEKLISKRGADAVSK